jgi:hypothetical protein|tara:strand:+ start:119 stop:283 length:165 start_codon:yes stop_codon:yes gene_type:complete
MINVTFSPVVSEYLKTIMIKKYKITDTSSSGARKFLTEKIVKEFEEMKIPLKDY